MTYRSPFPYSAADYRAREAGLAVLGCHRCLPADLLAWLDGLECGR